MTGVGSAHVHDLGTQTRGFIDRPQRVTASRGPGFGIGIVEPGAAREQVARGQACDRAIGPPAAGGAEPRVNVDGVESGTSERLGRLDLAAI